MPTGLVPIYPITFLRCCKSGLRDTSPICPQLSSWYHVLNNKLYICTEEWCATGMSALASCSEVREPSGHIWNTADTDIQSPAQHSQKSNQPAPLMCGPAVKKKKSNLLWACEKKNELCKTLSEELMTSWKLYRLFSEAGKYSVFDYWRAEKTASIKGNSGNKPFMTTEWKWLFLLIIPSIHHHPLDEIIQSRFSHPFKSNSLTAFLPPCHTRWSIYVQLLKETHDLCSSLFFIILTAHHLLHPSPLLPLFLTLTQWTRGLLLADGLLQAADDAALIPEALTVGCTQGLHLASVLDTMPLQLDAVLVGLLLQLLKVRVLLQKRQQVGHHCHQGRLG